jgi:hypothetical protein
LNTIGIWRAVALVVPALLPERVLRDQREEHRVEIDIDEVVEILRFCEATG